MGPVGGVPAPRTTRKVIVALPFMFERFLTSDRSFSRGRKE
jgi:hypothetical protein